MQNMTNAVGTSIIALAYLCVCRRHNYALAQADD